MRHRVHGPALFQLSLCLALAHLGCATEDPPSAATEAPALAASPHRSCLPPARRSPRAVTWSSEHELVLVDAKTGALFAKAKGAGLDGVRDSPLDVHAHRVVVFEGDFDATWGEVATYALGESSLGERTKRGYLEGDARILPMPGGILLFEDGPAPRWKVLRDDNAPTIGIAMERPVSIAVTDQGDARRIDALAYGDTTGALMAEFEGAIAKAARSPSRRPTSSPSRRAGRPRCDRSRSPPWALPSLSAPRRTTSRLLASAAAKFGRGRDHLLRCQAARGRRINRRPGSSPSHVASKPRDRRRAGRLGGRRLLRRSRGDEPQATRRCACRGSLLFP